MSVKSATARQMIGHIVLVLSQLSEEDLPLVIEFVDYLKQQPHPPSKSRLSVAEIRAEARQQARSLNKMPRTEVVTRFKELVEEIRQEAIVKGTAIEGDWVGD